MPENGPTSPHLYIFKVSVWPSGGPFPEIIFVLDVMGRTGHKGHSFDGQNATCALHVPPAKGS